MNYFTAFKAHLPSMGYQLVNQSENTINALDIGYHVLVLEHLNGSKILTLNEIQDTIDKYLSDDQQPSIKFTQALPYIYILIPFQA